MRTMGSSGSESSTPDKVATAASIFTEQSNLVSKCKRFEQKYRLALEQKVNKSDYCVVFFRLSVSSRSAKEDQTEKFILKKTLGPGLFIIQEAVGSSVCFLEFAQSQHKE